LGNTDRVKDDQCFGGLRMGVLSWDQLPPWESVHQKAHSKSTSGRITLSIMSPNVLLQRRILQCWSKNVSTQGWYPRYGSSEKNDENRQFVSSKQTHRSNI